MRSSGRRWNANVVFAALFTAGLTCASSLLGAEPASNSKFSTARAKGVEFLKASQSDDGSWTTNQSPGISGLVIFALIESGVPTNEPALEKAIQSLSSYIQPDGGIYAPKSDLRNYETCISLLAFHAANKDGRHDKTIAAARDFLKKLQWGEEYGVKADDARFGGAGYSPKSRPDLSNTAYLIEALEASGIGKDDPAMKNALIFISRCQNLESEFNTLPAASKINDGGFFYTPTAAPNPAGGKGEDGGLRSYGSMTYAGLKSMVHAGVGPDDPRVKAAVKWITQHYSVSENPGMGQAGLYYYFHLFAKALDAAEFDKVADASGAEHNWRDELGSHIVSLQKPNGSWVNSEKRWMEGDPNLSTAFALLTLAYCDQKTKPAGK